MHIRHVVLHNEVGWIRLSILYKQKACMMRMHINELYQESNILCFHTVNVTAMQQPGSSKSSIEDRCFTKVRGCLPTAKNCPEIWHLMKSGCLADIIKSVPRTMQRRSVYFLNLLKHPAWPSSGFQPRSEVSQTLPKRPPWQLGRCVPAGLGWRMLHDVSMVQFA